jgi:choline dehydrogenase-like flavoprotein
MAHTNGNVTTYDFVIIGGGTSGPAAARRLAERDANCTVCLLEAGPRFVFRLYRLYYLQQLILCASNVDVLNSYMPGGWVMMPDKTPDWCFETVPQKGCNDRVISVPRGRLLGGCSTMNGTYLIRGTKADYDRIADMGNPGWSWEEMLPFFKAFEAFHSTEWYQADLTVRGTDGIIDTEFVRPAPISEKLLESFIDKGFEYKPDMFVQGAYEGLLHSFSTMTGTDIRIL